MNTSPCLDASRHGDSPSARGTWLTTVTLLVSVAATAALLAGCVNPGPRTEHRALMAPATSTAAAADAPWPPEQWWQGWGDDGLARLIEQAVAAQPGLQAVQARLRQAQSAVDGAEAARLPRVDASADLVDQHFTKNGMTPPPLAGSNRWNSSAQIGASWELDLFGRQRAALESAIGQLRAHEADAQAARTLLAANVAAGYIALARQLEVREVAQRGLQQRQQVLELVRQRIAAGLDTSVELRQAEGFIAQTRVELEALDESIVRTRHMLAELTGQPPDALAGLAPRLAQLRGAPLPTGLPADLVGRRADLVAQRWRVQGALSDVEVARAQFYPNVNLVAFVGLSSIGLDRFLEAGAKTYSAGPALRLPIFDAGRLRAGLKARNAEVDAAIEGYNATLLRALREVADELGSLQSLERQTAAQSDALAAAESAFGLALQRYQAGLGNFLVVLTAESNVLAQRRATTELRARQLTTQITLTRALGGGYQAEARAVAAVERQGVASTGASPVAGAH